MMLLVTGITGYEDIENTGWLITPRSGESMETVIASGKPFACDNDCFNAWNEARYWRMIKRVKGQPDLLWVTVPDVVADHEATLIRFNQWKPKLTDVPLAFVAQNGCTTDTVPWDYIECVFIGGDTEWKLGSVARSIVQEAKLRGKLVHMGRVNSVYRMRYAASIGCDTVDGTQWSRFRKTYKELAKIGLSKPLEVVWN
jgi:hypothetical protein